MNRRHFIAAMSALAALPLLPKAARAAPERLPRGMVTFTFDDGIASNYQYALPILRSRGHLATAGIVVTRMLSGNNDYMSVDQVRELAASGWEIASHSLTHSRPIQIPKTYEQEPIADWHADQADGNLFQAQYEYERIAGLYQDGQTLKEVENLSQLRSVKGSYWHDQAIAELHVHPLRGGDPSGLGILAGSYQREMEQSKKMLAGLGFDVDTYIAPHNYWTEDVEAISRRYYRRACTGATATTAPRPSILSPSGVSWPTPGIPCSPTFASSRTTAWNTAGGWCSASTALATRPAGSRCRRKPWMASRPGWPGRTSRSSRSARGAG